MPLRPSTSVLVWTSPAPVYDPSRDRYAYGACPRGLPWQSSDQRDGCSGDCHPDLSD